MLFKDLSETFDIQELQTRNLTQDCLENFFGVIRMANSTNNRPDAFSFKAAYRATVVNQLLHLSKKCNSQLDAGAGLLEIKDFPKLEISNSKTDIQTKGQVELNTNLEEFDAAQLENICYTAGWISSTITHMCCVENLSSDSQLIGSSLAKLKSSEHQFCSQKLMSLLTAVVSHFNENFDKMLKESPVGIKAKTVEYVLNTSDVDILCNKCKVEVCDRYVNMLIKAKVKLLNEISGSKRKQTKKKLKTSGREKAQKLNID